MEAYAHKQLEAERKPRPARAPSGRRRDACFAAVSAPAKGKAAVVVKGKAAAPPNLGAVLQKASATAFRGGVAGFAAGVVQARGGVHGGRRGRRLFPPRGCEEAEDVGAPRLLTASHPPRSARLAPSCGCAR